MWWFSRKEDAPPGLPDSSYALFKLADGWWYVRSWPDGIKGERYRDGPYPDREDARYWAWNDAWDNGLVKKTDTGE